MFVRMLIKALIHVAKSTMPKCKDGLLLITLAPYGYCVFTMLTAETVLDLVYMCMLRVYTEGVDV